ncbi:MAG: WG repeat-containing protein [Candidatus Staskawiczbacteria bacterium]|jgi:hypothetical protein
MGQPINTRAIIEKEKYDWVSHFSCDRACAQKDGKQFHVKPDGKPAYRRRFAWVGAFDENGRAHVKNGEKWLIIGLNGREVKPCLEIKK